jgi:hypothetical protein
MTNTNKLTQFVMSASANFASRDTCLQTQFERGCCLILESDLLVCIPHSNTVAHEWLRNKKIYIYFRLYFQCNLKIGGCHPTSV